MGLNAPHFEDQQAKDQEQEKRVIRVMETVKVPVQVAAKRFYHDEPKAFLQWLTTTILLVLLVLTGFIRPLPLGLYLTVCVYLVCQEAIMETIYGIIKQITKKKK